jgi:diaminopimelate decarboxylase
VTAIMRRRMAAATAHVLPEASETRDGRLLIGGCDAEALAREHGTPAYVFAEDDLRARARGFMGALAAHHDGPGHVVFASKALPCTPVLRLFAEEGLGCDVASGGELHLALHAGFAPERIYLHGNAKSRAELAMAVEAGVGTIVLDNGEDALRLAELLAGRGTKRVLLRVTPGVDADTHEAILTGQAGSKFGFAPDDARALIADPPAGLEIAGLHMHLGSQLFALEPYRRAIRALSSLGDFGTYDLGGGLGVPYTADDPQLDVETWVAGMVEAAHAELGSGRELVLEPGRALVASAGVTLYTVESVKTGAAGERLVAVDGGMSDNLRPMLYGAGYEAHVVTRMGAAGVPSSVVGKHCESGDVLVRDAELPDPRAGDVIVTPATGAYGYALANNYNGQPRPPVVFCSDGASRVVVRRETYEELHGRDV